MNKKTRLLLIVGIIIIVVVAAYLLIRPGTSQPQVVDIPNSGLTSSQASPLATETAPTAEVTPDTDNTQPTDTPATAEPTPVSSNEPSSPGATEEPRQIIGKSFEQIVGSSSIDGELYAGDKNGNSNNCGLAAVSDNYLFITEDFNLDTQNDGKIARFNLITGEKIILVNAPGSDLLYNGGWLYFTNIKEGHTFSGGPVYRVSDDGSNLELLSKGLCGKLAIIDNYLIFYNYDDEKLYKKNLSDIASEPECIVSHELRWINHADDKLMFYDTKQKIIQSMDINTNEITDIYQVNDILYMTYSGGKLYFIKKYDGKGLLTSYDLNTKEEKTLIDKSIAMFNIYKDKIVFTYPIEGQSIESMIYLESMVYLFDQNTEAISEIGIGNIGAIYGNRMIYWAFPPEEFDYVKMMDLPQ